MATLNARESSHRQARAVCEIFLSLPALCA
jgi:hypothetical protein